jgi:hypothetical protein
MRIAHIFPCTGKWLKRLILAFMLGFSNAINQETNMVDDTTTKTEQTLKR